MTVSDDPFFIVGSGRSGTTLLQTLLSRHPRIAVPPETHYLARVDAQGGEEDGAPKDFESFWADLIAWSRFTDLGVDPADVRARIDATERDYRGIFTAMLSAYAETVGAVRIGEKTPGHRLYLETLFDWYPSTRILFMRRDPRAVVASHMKSPWVTEQMRSASVSAPMIRRLRAFHVAERAELWREANGTILSRYADDERVMVVDYERLVEAPEGTMRAVCAFLAETYLPSMMPVAEGSVAGPSGERGETAADWRAAHEAKAAAPVTTQSLEKWRSELSDAEVAMIEAICEAPMRLAGHELVSGAEARRRNAMRASLLSKLDAAERRVRGALGRP